MDLVNHSRQFKGKQHRYDILFIRYIVKVYASGTLSITQLSEKYDIAHQNISRWVRQFSGDLIEQNNQIKDIMTEQEQKDMLGLKKQIEQLEKKLEYEQIRNFALETMADLAKTELGIDIRKNFGAKQPKK